MQDNERDEYWRTLWNIYYQVYYHELLSARVRDRLLLATRISDLMTAVTASGSAVAAWAVWSMNGMSAAWVVLSSTAAILSIVFQAFGIRDLTKRYTESRSMAQALRLKIESYRNKLRIVTNWDLDALMKQLDEFDKENLAFLMQHPGDGMLETKFLMKASQDKLDHILQREISG